MKTLRGAVCSSLLILGLAGAGAAQAPADAAALAAVAGQALMQSQANPDLQQLSDTIGGRVTGSPQAQAAIAWALAKMKAMGLKHVHAEPWTMDHGWTRGKAAIELTAPVRRTLHGDSMGWVGSTPAGGVEAELVEVNSCQLPQETQAHAGAWRGKALLLRPQGPRPKNPISTFVQMAAFLKAAHQAGAVAVFAGQGAGASAGMNLTHTGVVGFNTVFEIPVVNLTAEDQLLLERLLDLHGGAAVRLHVDVENHVSGPTPSANVMGDIPGREDPQQIVVIGGHLDSWDLSSGATDDGTGAVAALAAAQAIVASGERPRRTVRVVLFTGEEQGLLGSLAYVQTHQNEMANHVAALILDEGQGPISALQVGGHDDVMPALEPLVHTLTAFGVPKINDDSSFDTDSGPFILAGVAGINLSQDSPAYAFTHHSVVDTFDHVLPDVLVRNAAELGVMAYYVADLPQRLGPTWTPAQVEAKLKAQHLEEELRAFGLWRWQ
ncbi:MAG TPA: M20/M25/M40 family metallo-hydrolase [Terriglobales bacterium]|nr:M20/M25/M40 family metallo-hydrolase [Terriglobales bacterium]